MALTLEETRKLSHIQRLKTGYHYFRHRSGVSGRLPGAENSEQYIAEYFRLLARAEHRTPRAEGERPERITFKVGDVGWVAAQYAGDAENGLRSRKPGTQRAYARDLEILRDALPADKRHGSNIAHIPIAGMDREHVKKHCALVQAKMGKARADHQQLILSVLFQYADDHLPQCKLGRIANPARGRKRGYKAKPRLPWPPEVVRDALGDGCKPHVRHGIGVLFYTGQRGGDVCLMQWHDYKGDTLVVEEQEKTGARVELTVHRELRKLLMRAPRTCNFIVTTKTGRKYSAANSLSKEIQARLVEIGQPNGKYVMHGLRKASAVYLAYKGATVKQLMDWFGWRSPRQALYYVEQAEKAKLNKQTAALWDAA
jgi:integrase